MNTTTLVLVASAVVAVAVGVVAVWFRGARSADMGSVSHTWVAELRAGEPYDSNR